MTVVWEVDVAVSEVLLGWLDGKAAQGGRLPRSTRFK